MPPLASLERLSRRTISVSLPLLTLGLAAGIVRLRQEGDGLDALDVLGKLKARGVSLHMIDLGGDTEPEHGTGCVIGVF